MAYLPVLPACSMACCRHSAKPLVHRGWNTSLPSGLTPACMLPLQYGLLLFLCQAIGALGLPYVLVVWPTHAFRAWTCKSPVNFSFSSGKLPALNLDPLMPQVGAMLSQLV